MELAARARTHGLQDSFSPIGFGDDPNALLYYELHEGRTALFALDLAKERQRRLVYSHDTFDVGAVHSLGKYERLVAAAYHDDRPRLHFFDEGLAKAHRALAALFPDKGIAITDESWDQRYYLVFVSSAEDPGTYYRFDRATNEPGRITVAYSSLADRKLAVMRPIRYAAEDGVEIPAYLTLPANWSAPRTAVVLPQAAPLRATIGPTTSSPNTWRRAATRFCKATIAAPTATAPHGAAKADFAVGAGPSRTSQRARSISRPKASQIQSVSARSAGATAATPHS